MKKLTLLITSGLITIALSSCASQNNAQYRAGQGALIGGAAGGIIGHQSGKAGEGAALGGALGGIIGHAVGSEEDKKEGNYPSQNNGY